MRRILLALLIVACPSVVFAKPPKQIVIRQPANAYEKFARNRTAIDARNPYAYYSDEATANVKRLKAQERAIESKSPKPQRPAWDTIRGPEAYIE